MRQDDLVSRFLAKYPESVYKLASSIRSIILSAIPEASETLDESGRVVGYGIGAGYSGLVCTIIPSKTGVKLGIVNGGELPDPYNLLEGTGKRHRYVQFRDSMDHARIVELLHAARDAADRRRKI